LHGLAWAEVRDHGHSAPTVCSALSQDLSARSVYCDGPAFDRDWLRQLYAAAGIEAPFWLYDSADLFKWVSSEPFVTHETLEELRDGVINDSPNLTPHRAAGDVAIQLAMYRRLVA